MPIKNYTTKISAKKTASEIQEILAEHGARKIMIDYSDKGVPECISFGMNTPGGFRSYQFPANIPGMAAALAAQGVKCDGDHAADVAWRNLKNIIEAMLAFVEAGQAAMEELFLPYMTNAQGVRMYQALSAKGFLLGTNNPGSDSENI